jgi:hypothetical protein
MVERGNVPHSKSAAFFFAPFLLGKQKKGCIAEGKRK